MVGFLKIWPDNLVPIGHLNSFIFILITAIFILSYMILFYVLDLSCSLFASFSTFSSFCLIVSKFSHIYLSIKFYNKV